VNRNRMSLPTFSRRGTLGNSWRQLAGNRSMNEVYPLERVTEACERMMSGKARFRVVLAMSP
jgi:hypothetical protein